MSYHLITCIVERGKARILIDAALGAGAQAATYFSGRGRGVRERIGFFGRFIQPEKEIVLIVTKAEQTNKIFDIMVFVAKLKEPGKGFAYVQPVEQAVGFLE